MKKHIIYLALFSTFFLGHCVSSSKYKSLARQLQSEQKRSTELQKIVARNADEQDVAQALEKLLKNEPQFNEKELESVKSFLSKLKNAIGLGKLKVRISGKRVVLVLPSDILFDSGSVTISKAGFSTVKKVTDILIQNTDYNYQIEGHTDDVPIHTLDFPSNWELAAKRALNVLHVMVTVGMPPERLSSASFADTRPIRLNETEASRAYNRRIEIALVPDLSSLSLAQDKKQIAPKGR